MTTMLMNINVIVCWCNDDYEGKDFSSAVKRRACAIEYVRNNNIQGYLAYANNKIVGWCNANAKSDCLKCASWRRSMEYVPLEESEKVKSVFCFVVAPEMKRNGIATQLLERVCQDAAQDGFDYVEAYPDKELANDIDFKGPIEMYKRSGFITTYEIDEKLIVRKQLK